MTMMMMATKIRRTRTATIMVAMMVTMTFGAFTFHLLSMTTQILAAAEAAVSALIALKETAMVIESHGYHLSLRHHQ